MNEIQLAHGARHSSSALPFAAPQKTRRHPSALIGPGRAAEHPHAAAALAMAASAEDPLSQIGRLPDCEAAPDCDHAPAEPPPTPTLQSLTPTLQQMILTSGSLSSKDLGRLECVAKKFDGRPLRVLIECVARELVLRMNDNAHVTMTRVHERKRWLRALHQLETLEPRSLAGVRRPVPATLRQRSACLQPSAAGS